MHPTQLIKSNLIIGGLMALFFACNPKNTRTNSTNTYLQISGIYPHLATFNRPEDSTQINNHRECGIGAVVPWANKLWYLTYPPHMRRGSNDKLYEVDTDLNLNIRSESVGGTHANRMIHRESQQLIIGPYVIDSLANVRSADVNQLVGRMTATTRHLTDPENQVYFFDMEGAIYEMNVHNLAINKLFEKPVPGWHGKGAYVAQGRLVIANNGEHLDPNDGLEHALAGVAAIGEEAGVLAEWDGDTWRIVERKQFTDVTGPGDIYGNADDQEVLWSMGWDKRSVMLKVLDQGKWHTYRLPKGSHSFDPRHGWYTEWPRIRKLGKDNWMMVMHGSMFDFPQGFNASQTGGIRPITTHLRYIPDFCMWNNQLILAADDASTMENPLVGQPQSNLWFGTQEDLANFGPKAAWGGVWLNDPVKANTWSDPILLAGYEQRVIHLAHEAPAAIRFTLQVDETGNGNWVNWQAIGVEANGYTNIVIPEDLSVEWLRIKVDQPCTATAYLHYFSSRKEEIEEMDIFNGLAYIGTEETFTGGPLYPAAHNRSLQFWAQPSIGSEETYLEIALDTKGEKLDFSTPNKKEVSAIHEELPLSSDYPFQIDEASILVTDSKGNRFRLPKGSEAFDQPTPMGWPRTIREAVSERFLANIHGTFYEIPRQEGWSRGVPDFERMKPVSSHNRVITDFCTWRGLFVMSGVSTEAVPSEHIYKDESGNALWMGMIDDLWKLGKPTGVGGPWKNTHVKAGMWSDPYLMTHYEEKRVDVSHDAPSTAVFTIEVNVDHHSWYPYTELYVPEGETLSFQFPRGFQAHWVRVKVNKECKASAVFYYE